MRAGESISLNQIANSMGSANLERYSVSLYDTDGLSQIFVGECGGFGEALKAAIVGSGAHFDGRQFIIVNCERGNVMHVKTTIQVEVIG